MFPSPAVLLAFAAASVLLAATPGPDMALFLSRTLGGGRPHGFAALAGAMTGLLVHTCAAALGLSALLAASARAYDAVKLAGALYLLYLAYGALRHGAALRLEGQGGSRGGLPGSYLTGLLINLTNPKIVLFFVTFLPQFIDVGEAGASQKFFFLGFEFIAIGVAVNCRHHSRRLALRRCREGQSARDPLVRLRLRRPDGRLRGAAGAGARAVATET